MMKDDEKGKELTADGDYVDRDINEEKLDSQEVFYETAYKNTEKKQQRIFEQNKHSCRNDTAVIKSADTVDKEGRL